MFGLKSSASREFKRNQSVAGLLPVLPAEQLLASPKRQLTLARIREQTTLSDSFYQQIYQTLLWQFAEYVQLVPRQHGGRAGQILDDSLRRARLAAEICYEEGKDALLSYAIFTIALLQDLGQIPASYHVLISDEKGQFISEWSPLQERLTVEAKFYRLRPVNYQYSTLAQELTPILARQLLPVLGFQWLATQYTLLVRWLAALRGDAGGARGLWSILQLIDERFQKEINEEFELFSIVPLEPEATEAGEAFLEWLIRGLADGSIAVNESDAFVHVVEEGVLLEYPGVFKLFSETYPKYRDWTVVFQQYNMLGLAKLSGYDYKFEQFFTKAPGVDARTGTIRHRYFMAQQASTKAAKKTGKAIKGAIVSNPAILFLEKEAPAANPNLRSQNQVNAEHVLENLSKAHSVKRNKAPKFTTK